jgi:ABC-type transport system involved in Fe-S cluster assembly fused permease/ATPase subunit
MNQADNEATNRIIESLINYEAIKVKYLNIIPRYNYQYLARGWHFFF